MKPLDLEAIRARTEAATKGPWTVGVRWEDPYDVYWVPINSPSTCEDDPHQPDRVALIRYSAGAFQFPHYDALSDAAFIANARQDIPALVAEVERLRAEVERYHPVTDPSGDVLYIHNHETPGYRCGHVEWWNEAVHGPINDQGCDACESAPDGSWRPLYLRSGGA